MTREEAIKKLEFLKILLPAAKDEISDIIKLIETPWINIKDDLPYNHRELLDSENTATKMETIPVLAGISFDIFSVSWMEKRKDKWIWHSMIEPQFWMPIPELPKE